MRPSVTFESLAGRSAEWQTDYNTGHRYRMERSVEFWESGRVIVKTKFDRDPYAREMVSKLLGVQVDTLHALPNGLLDEFGNEVKKAWVEDAPALWDHQHNVILPAEWGPYSYHPRQENNGYVTYPHPDAMPYSHRWFNVAKPDKAAASVMWKELERYIVPLVTQYKMGGMTRPPDVKGETLANWLLGKCGLTDAVKFAVGSSGITTMKDKIKETTKIRTKSRYFSYKKER